MGFLLFRGSPPTVVPSWNSGCVSRRLLNVLGDRGAFLDDVDGVVGDGLQVVVDVGVEHLDADVAAGQVVKVFVVPTEEAGRKIEDLAGHIIEHCSESMPNYMVPRFVELVEELPTTATGKVDYPALYDRG